MIIWSEAEQRLLATKLFERWKLKPLDKPMTIFEWIMANDWPADRRRKLKALTEMPKVMKQLHSLIKQFMEKQDAGEPASNGAASEHELSEMLKSITVREPVPYDAVVFMKEQPTLVLVQELLHRLTSPRERELELLERIEQRLEQKQAQSTRYAPVPPALPQAPPVPKPRKPCIGVAGLLNDQFQHVARNVGEKADLRHLHETTHGVTAPASADYLVLNTKFISHKVEDSLKAQGFGSRIVLVDGGVTAVTQKVLDICSRQ